jgi:UPF0716 protein FxsA
MRFLTLGILLAFPVVDVYVTARLAQQSGIPLWVTLLSGTVAGILLLRNERSTFRSKTLASMHGHYSLLRSLLDSGRKVLAGFLFLMPGVLSDLVALALLALPINLGPRLRAQTIGPGFRPPARPKALEGEFRRLD